LIYALYTIAAVGLVVDAERSGHSDPRLVEFSVGGGNRYGATACARRVVRAIQFCASGAFLFLQELSNTRKMFLFLANILLKVGRRLVKSWATNCPNRGNKLVQTLSVAELSRQSCALSFLGFGKAPPLTEVFLGKDTLSA
jgi:hypothetical protein